MLTNFDAYNRPLYLERLLWGDEFEEVKTCEIMMAAENWPRTPRLTKANSLPLSLAQKIEVPKTF